MPNSTSTLNLKNTLFYKPYLLPVLRGASLVSFAILIASYAKIHQKSPTNHTSFLLKHRFILIKASIITITAYSILEIFFLISPNKKDTKTTPVVTINSTNNDTTIEKTLQATDNQKDEFPKKITEENKKSQKETSEKPIPQYLTFSEKEFQHFINEEERINLTLSKKQLIVNQKQNVFKKQIPKTLTTQEIDKRYLMYCKVIKYKNNLILAHGEIQKRLARNYKAVELALQMHPNTYTKSDWEDLELLVSLSNELSSKKYLFQEATSILGNFFSIYRISPQARTIQAYVKGKLLQKRSENIFTKTHPTIYQCKERTKNDVFFFSKNNNPSGKFAKYKKGGNLKEIDAFQISLRLGIYCVPLTTKFSTSKILFGTLQEYLPNLKTVDVFLSNDKKAAKILKTAPVHYVQTYLLQAIILGQYDAHQNNIAIKLSDENKFKGFIDFDNEYILPRKNYITGHSHEGKGLIRIPLVGLPQARKPLSRAMLLLLSSRLFKVRIMGYFKNTTHLKKDKEVLSALEERLDHIQKICDYVKDKPDFLLTIEDLYACLFTHVDFLINNRKNKTPSLIAYTQIHKAYPDTVLSLSIPSNQQEINRCQQLKELDDDLQLDTLPTLVEEQYTGESTMRGLRHESKKTSNKPTKMKFNKNNLKETLWEKYKNKEIPSYILPLFLLGTPSIVSRRIHREFPNADIKISDENNQYLLVVNLKEKGGDSN